MLGFEKVAAREETKQSWARYMPKLPSELYFLLASENIIAK
jgi:hypothetical protein